MHMVIARNGFLPNLAHLVRHYGITGSVKNDAVPVV
jgi:hypothetical protein